MIRAGAVHEPEQATSTRPLDASRGTSWRSGAARLCDRAVFFSLLTLLVLTAIPYGTVEPWWEAAFECAIFALAALWLIEGMISGSWRPGGRALILPLCPLAGFALIQTLPLRGAGVAISADPYGTRLFVLKLLALTLAGVLLRRYTCGRGRLYALIYAIIGVGVASAMFGLARQVTQHNAPGFVLPFLEPGSGYGQFINRNHFAFLMEMSLGLVLGLMAERGRPFGRLLLYAGLALPMGATLVLSNSRGGLFAMLSQLVFFTLLWRAVRSRRGDPARVNEPRRRSWRAFAARAALSACLLAALTFGIAWVGGDPLVNRLETVPGELSAEAAGGRDGIRRVEVWRATWDMIKANPVAGTGFGGYRAAIPAYHDASGQFTPQEAHNDYLELLAGGGVIGLGLGGWFVLALIRDAARRLFAARDSWRRAARLGALAGLFAVAVHSFVDFGLQITINALIFTALVVIATGDDRVAERGLRSGRTR